MTQRFILAWVAFAGIVFTVLYDPSRNCGDHKGAPKSCREKRTDEGTERGEEEVGEATAGGERVGVDCR